MIEERPEEEALVAHHGTERDPTPANLSMPHGDLRAEFVEGDQVGLPCEARLGGGNSILTPDPVTTPPRTPADRPPGEHRRPAERTASE